MERIKDGRRNILIHGNATEDDLPVDGLSEIPKVAGVKPFVPKNMDEPKLYSGDVIVGYYDGEIRFAELIYDKVDGGVLVIPLDSGIVTLHDDSEFSRRFYQADEMHIYDAITDEVPEMNVEFDESKLERPETTRAR